MVNSKFSSTSQLNVAVVGLRFGAEFVPIYQRHPDVGQVGIYDLNPKVTEEVGDRFGVEARLKSLDAILADERWDAVHLLTPVPLHAEETLKVLRAGKHCACAVPMTTSLDLTSILQAQQKSGKNYMLMETSRYDRAFLYAKDLLDRGELGNLTFIRGDYFQDLEGAYPTYWSAQPPMHYATHALSPLLALAGRRATAVTCLGSSRLRSDIQQPGGNVFPLQTALFQLEDSDVIAQLTRSWFQIARSNTEAFSVYGDLRSFEWQQLDHEDPVLYTLEPLRPGERGRPATVQRVKVPYRPDLYPAELRDYMEGWHGGSHPHLVHEFIRSIVEQRPPDHRRKNRSQLDRRRHLRQRLIAPTRGHCPNSWILTLGHVAVGIALEPQYPMPKTPTPQGPNAATPQGLQPLVPKR